MTLEEIKQKSISPKFLSFKENKPLQQESLDQNTRVRLWNLIDEFFEANINREAWCINNECYEAMKFIWDIVFKLPINKLDRYEVSHTIKAFEEQYFSESTTWKNIYNIIRIVSRCIEKQKGKKAMESFCSDCNWVLEQENAGYRILEGEIYEYLSDLEREEIYEAKFSPFQTVSEHISKALKKHSGLEGKDYGGSIDEAVSAVESMAQIITGENRAILTDALTKPEIKNKTNPKLIEAIKQLYLYASDISGGRHSHKPDKVEPTKETSSEMFIPNKNKAKFILHICSAIVNYFKAEGYY